MFERGFPDVFPFRLEPDEFDICRRVAGAGNDHGFLLDPKVFFVDAVNELARRFARLRAESHRRLAAKKTKGIATMPGAKHRSSGENSAACQCG